MLPLDRFTRVYEEKKEVIDKRIYMLRNCPDIYLIRVQEFFSW